MKNLQIKIGDLIIPKQHQIMNDAPKGKKIIGTVFNRSSTTIKKELEPYFNKGYEFYYYTFMGYSSTIHTVRILKTI